MLRNLAWWLFDNVRLGPFAPWVFGYAIGRKPERVSERVHLQNEFAKWVEYWQDRHELPFHAFRKEHQWRRYDGRVEVGEPLATRWCTTEQLRSAGIVGLWGYKREDGETD